MTGDRGTGDRETRGRGDGGGRELEDWGGIFGDFAYEVVEVSCGNVVDVLEQRSSRCLQ